jgi:hypothetical protein
LTSLFGGNWGGVCLPIIGTVEPSWEKATEPFEQDTAGDNSVGLLFLLECCETEIVDSLFIHEALLDDTWVPASDSSAPCSLAAKPLTTALGGPTGGAAPLVVILLIIGRLWGRPSSVRVAIGMREVGTAGIGALKGATVVVVAEVVWVVEGIEPGASSCAGVAFLLFEFEESRGGPRPKDRPTADAPTTVAVAQSCVTKMRQSLPSVRL